jgi:hypothetical protein
MSFARALNRAIFGTPVYSPAEERALNSALEDLKAATGNGEPHGFAEFYDEQGRRRVMCASADGAVSSWELEPGAEKWRIHSVQS